MKPDRLYFVSFVCRCHAVNVCDNAAYFYEKINEDLRMGGLDVQAEDIIDIIDGYKGKGYAISSQEELGKCRICDIVGHLGHCDILKMYTMYMHMCYCSFIFSL